MKKFFLLTAMNNVPPALNFYVDDDATITEIELYSDF